MAGSSNVTRDGTAWEPQYIEAIDPEKCIGCGRCYKVCGRGVLKMMGIDEDGGLIPADDDDSERMVMTIGDQGKCIGCQSCAQVCGKSAQTFVAASAV
jgi:Nif-specific ferredoxin III